MNRTNECFVAKDWCAYCGDSEVHECVRLGNEPICLGCLFELTLDLGIEHYIKQLEAEHAAVQ